ncbi:hypothetical protein SALBM311S_05747 [Streptomyces alboniger]
MGGRSPGIVPVTEPALFAGGMPGLGPPLRLASPPTGTAPVLLLANGEGTGVRLRTESPASVPATGPCAG